MYASCGVQHVWLIEPERGTIEVYESIGGRPTLVTTARGSDVVRLAPFDAELALGAWWKRSMAVAEPPPPSP